MASAPSFNLIRGFMILLAVFGPTPFGVAAAPEASAAQDKRDIQATAAEVKSALVFQFAKFITWPDELAKNLGPNLRFGVLGDNEVARELTELSQDKTIGGKTFTVAIFEKPEDVANVHLLFIGRDAGDQVQEILTKVRGQGIVSIGDDISDFLNSGGIISLVERDRKIRFDINIAAARAAGLTISTALTELADKLKR